MSQDLELELDIDKIRKNFLIYTRRAFEMLPKIENPRILDVGCGSGVPTIELAKLSGGEIAAIDIDKTLLDSLNRKIEKEGLSDRIKTKNCSIYKIPFPNESFDILWAEGIIAIIGFKKGLTEWQRLLKPNGFMVIHDDNKDITSKLKEISKCGYNLIDYFTLPDGAWWVEYYEPLEKRIKELRVKYEDNPDALKILKKHQNEVNMIKKNPKGAYSVFFIIQNQEKK